MSKMKRHGETCENPGNCSVCSEAYEAGAVYAALQTMLAPNAVQRAGYEFPEDFKRLRAMMNEQEREMLDEEHRPQGEELPF